MQFTRDFLRGRRRAQLSPEEREALEGAVDRVETIAPRTIVVRRGTPVSYSTLLVEGAMCRYMDARDGYRQLVAYQVPGDFVDLHGFPLSYLDHDIGTIVESTVAIVPHAAVQRLVEDWPRLARLLWFSTLLDAALHREWIFRLGRLNATGRVAHFLCETQDRLAATGRVTDGTFPLPLTQQDVGEACGLTSVHVNRTLRRLREDGLADLSKGVARIMDFPRLARLGEFDPDYLYLDGGPFDAK